MNIELFKNTLATRLEKEASEKAAQDLRDRIVNDSLKRGEDIVCQFLDEIKTIVSDLSYTKEKGREAFSNLPSLVITPFYEGAHPTVCRFEIVAIDSGLFKIRYIRHSLMEGDDDTDIFFDAITVEMARAAKNIHI